MAVILKGFPLGKPVQKIRKLADYSRIYEKMQSGLYPMLVIEYGTTFL